MLYTDLIAKLIALRKHRDISQGELADRLRIKRASVGHREQLRSSATLDDLSDWAEALGADLRIELVSDRQALKSGVLFKQIDALDEDGAQLLHLLLRVLPHLDDRDTRSVRLLLSAYLADIQESKREAK